jgi:hypothetical protein
MTFYAAYVRYAFPVLLSISECCCKPIRYYDRIAFYGRIPEEYLLMFGIRGVTSLKRYNTILDCPSGASSFVAEANSKNETQAIGCNCLFDKDVETLIA